MSMLYILCGLPFSGKTTLAKELIEKYQWSFVGIDEINRERGIGVDITKPITPDEREITYKLTEEKTKQLLGEGKTVIYDATNFTFQQRQKLRDLAKSCQSSARIIYVATSKADVIKRWMDNRQTGKRNDVREDDFMRVVNNFQVPTDKENPIIYHNGDSLDIITT